MTNLIPKTVNYAACLYFVCFALSSISGLNYRVLYANLYGKVRVDYGRCLFCTCLLRVFTIVVFDHEMYDDVAEILADRRPDERTATARKLCF